MHILFLCSHGGAKSVIAASHFNRLAAQHGLSFVATAAAAEEPYDAVPSPVSEHLQRDGFDVRSFKPRPAGPGEIETAARIVAIGCDLPAARESVQSERWDDVPQASDDLEASIAAIRRHVEALTEELRGRR